MTDIEKGERRNRQIAIERLIDAQAFLGRAIERLAAAQMYHWEPGLRKTAGQQCRQQLDAAQSQIAEANHWLGRADALEELDNTDGRLQS